ncbi:MAG: pantothenate synthetase PanC [Chloroflexota bacterium]
MSEAGALPSGTRRLVIAVDGPGSSGKSSVGVRVAAALGYRFCDTGLLYRAVTWLATSEGVAVDDEAAVAALVPRIGLEDDGSGALATIVVDGTAVGEGVASAAVDAAVSGYAALPAVRDALLQRQRELARHGGIVMAGRDIGTVVLPDADLKVFLDASVGERAARRARQRGLDPASTEGRRILDELRLRDELDSTRPVAPLRAAPDAVHVATDGLGEDAVVDRVLELAREVATSHRRSSAERARRRGEGRRLSDRRPLFVRLTHLVGLVVARLLTRATVEGLDRPDLPRTGPLIVTVNHLSNSDPILIGPWLGPALGRQLHWVGKEELLRIPLIGWAIAENGVIGIRRGEGDIEAFRLAKRVLDEGHVLVIFPEGTRSRTGGLGRAKAGVGLLAVRTGAPILPVALTGTERLWPRGGLPRPGARISMRVGAPYRLAPSGGSDRRRAQEEATETIMRRIAELLPPSYRGAYADGAGQEDPAAPVR